MAASGVPQFASLYVGDLHVDVTEAMLYEIFNSVGPVASIRVCRDSITRRSLGYAYVNFHAVSDAERALDTLNYSSIKGRACRIMWSQRDPSLRKSGVGNVHVKNLDKNIDNKALYDTFSLFGNILSCKVACDIHGKSYGYGFVHYETEEAAKQAVERVNGMQIGEKTVHVARFEKRTDRTKPEITNFTNLYVKDFPQDWEDEQLTEKFKEFGEIASLVVMKDKKDRKFAFVNYNDTEHAKKAIEGLHGKDFRTDEQKAKDKEEKEKAKEGKEDKEGDDKKDDEDGGMYVQRAQTKRERALELRDKFSATEKPAVAAPARAQGVNLYIKNLDENTDDEALKGLFSTFGSITSAKAMQDDKGRCKGFGFVSFATPDEATKAVTEMHLKVVKGKPLYVGLAEKKEARAERLRQRYSATGASGGGGPPGKGGGMMGPMGGKGGPMGGKGGPGMGGPGMGPQGMMGGPMMGGGMMGGKGMMGPQQGMMPMGMPGKGMMGGPMMGNPQMMGMMGKGMPGPMMGKGMPGMMPGMPGAPMGMPGMMPGKGMMPMGGKGMMPGMMPGQMPGQKGGAPGGAPAPAPAPAAGGLTAQTLAAAPPAVQKQMIGEKLYPAIAKLNPELAGKITGMMLEMDNSELLILIESEAQLRVKVDEAMRVLKSAGN